MNREVSNYLSLLTFKEDIDDLFDINKNIL